MENISVLRKIWNICWEMFVTAELQIDKPSPTNGLKIETNVGCTIQLFLEVCIYYWTLYSCRLN